MAPLATLLVTIALGLGVGATTAVFSVVDAVLFRALRVPEPDRLVRLSTTTERRGSDRGALSHVMYRALLAEMRSLHGLALYRDGVMVHLATGREHAEAAQATIAGGRYFDILGLRPAAGRLLHPTDDETPGAHPVVVLSHAFWRRRYGGAADVVGRSVRINGRAFEIVGVAPAGFDDVGQETPADVFLSLSMADVAEPVYRGQLAFLSSAFFQAVGRLAPSATVEQAQVEVELVAERMGAGRPVTSGPEANDPSWRVPWLRVDLASRVAAAGARDFAWMLWASVLLVLLIGAADAASVLVARSDRRRKELAIRMALGSSRMQLVRERLAEGVWLALASGVCGLVFAVAITRALMATVSEGSLLPLHAAADLLSMRVLGIGTVLAAFVGLGTSLVPALRASMADPIVALKGDGSVPRRGRVPVRSALVVIQVALSLSLLMATALLVRSLQAAGAQHARWDVRSLYVGVLNLARGGYDVPRALAFQDGLRHDLERIPGVEAVALSSGVPPFGRGGTTVSVSGRPRRIAFEAVTPGFIRVLRWPLVRGRDLRPDDTNAVLIDAASAEQLWPGEEPLGKTIANFSPRRASLEVVGVVRPASPPTDGRGQMLIARSAFYGAFPWQPRTIVLVRAEGDPHRVMSAVAKAVEQRDADLPLLGLRSATDQLALDFADTRWLAAAFAILGMVALILSAAGIFGVIASAVEARRREIGVRVALGAMPAQIVRLVLGYSTRLVVAGAVFGIPGAVVLARGLSSFLFGVTPLDGLAMVTALTVMAATALVAAGGPARRALAVDPARVLRNE